MLFAQYFARNHQGRAARILLKKQALPAGALKNLLRVALLCCDARCTLVQLRFSHSIAAARDGFSKYPTIDWRKQ